MKEYGESVMLFFAGLIRIGPGAQGQPGRRRKGGRKELSFDALCWGEFCRREVREDASQFVGCKWC
jgi:hypothetical protein